MNKTFQEMSIHRTFLNNLREIIENSGFDSSIKVGDATFSYRLNLKLSIEIVESLKTLKIMHECALLLAKIVNKN